MLLNKGTVNADRAKFLIGVFFFVLILGGVEMVSALQEPANWWNITGDFGCSGSCNITNEQNTTSANLTLNSGDALNITNSFLNFTLGQFFNANPAFTTIDIFHSILRGANAGSLNRINIFRHPNLTIENSTFENFNVWNCDANTEGVIRITDSIFRHGTQEVFRPNGCRNIQVTNSQFYNTSSEECMQFRGGRHNLITNSRIYDCSDTGIFVNNNAINLTFTNLTINSTGSHCIHIKDTNQTIVEDSNHRDCVGYNYDFSGYGNNHLVRNNIGINGSNGVFFSMGDGGVGNSGNLTSSNNSIYNTSGFGVGFNTVHGGRSYNDFVSNATSRGLSIATNSLNINVTNITLTINPGFAIHVHVNSANVIIDNATITDSNTTFFFRQSENITIRNSLIESLEDHYGQISNLLVSRLNFTNVLGYNFFINDSTNMDFNLSSSRLYFESTSTNSNSINVTIDTPRFFDGTLTSGTILTDDISQLVVAGGDRINVA